MASQPTLLDEPIVQDSGVTLRNVAWKTYRALRDEPANAHVRMTYNRGVLQIMSPGRLHERIAALMDRFIFAWTCARDLPLASGGSLTMSREDLDRGCEPDKCYFIEHESAMRASDQFSLENDDPPPDLVLEVDVASLSASRMPIYAAMGVPEVWRWRNETLQVFTLSAVGEYDPQNDSRALPGFPLEEAARLLSERRRLEERVLVGEFQRHITG